MMDLSFLYSVDALLVSLLLVVVGYLCTEFRYGYWKRKGVPHLQPSSLVYGNVEDWFWSKDGAVHFYQRLYKSFQGKPFMGYYEFLNPVLLVRDLDLVKQVLTDKFNCFHDQKFYASEKNDELFSGNPFILTGSRWKDGRSIISPGLTTNKIRAHPELVTNVYKDMKRCIEKEMSGDIDVTLLMKKATCDVVASWGWGVAGDGFSEGSIVKKMFDSLFIHPIQFNAIILSRLLANLTGSRLFSKELTDFFVGMTEQSVRSILENRSTSPSLLRSILQSMSKTEKGFEADNKKDMILLTSYLTTFFLDGYETTGRAMSYTLYNLMLHPDIQDKLRDVILDTVGEGDITIDAVDRLDYLNMVISEALRHSPPVPYLGRLCTERCNLGGLDVDPGTYIIIPLQAIHMDSEHYPDPDSFTPENFSEEARRDRHPYAHLPFGMGPRICLGMKFAMAEMKVLICLLLRDHQLLPAEDHEVKRMAPLRTDSFFYIPEHDLYVRFKKLER